MRPLTREVRRILGPPIPRTEDRTASPEAPPKHLARRLGSPEMPTGIIHPFWIEALKEAASEILNAGFVVVSLVATPKGLPVANGRARRLAIHSVGGFVMVCPSDRLGHQVKPRGTVHQSCIPGRGYALLQRGGTGSAPSDRPKCPNSTATPLPHLPPKAKRRCVPTRGSIRGRADRHVPAMGVASAHVPETLRASCLAAGVAAPRP
jgi:hypothetical protein